jgi:hypothetical protein
MIVDYWLHIGLYQCRVECVTARLLATDIKQGRHSYWDAVKALRTVSVFWEVSVADCSGYDVSQSFDPHSRDLSRQIIFQDRACRQEWTETGHWPRACKCPTSQWGDGCDKFIRIRLAHIIPEFKTVSTIICIVMYSHSSFFSRSRVKSCIWSDIHGSPQLTRKKMKTLL